MYLTFSLEIQILKLFRNFGENWCYSHRTNLILPFSETTLNDVKSTNPRCVTPFIVRCVRDDEGEQCILHKRVFFMQMKIFGYVCRSDYRLARLYASCFDWFVENWGL